MKDGKITLVKKLDPNKYETIINLLLQKPPICEIKLWSFGGGFWHSCIVEFSKNPANYLNYSIEYSIEYLDRNTILYRFSVNKGNSSTCLAKLTIR